MSFLLDTNVISEPTRPRPDAGVLDWLAAADEDTVYLCAITIAELRYGIERLNAGRKRTQLDRWLGSDLRAAFCRSMPKWRMCAAACWPAASAGDGRWM